MGLEKQVKEVEDIFHETIESEAASRETVMLEATQQVVVEFKQSEEYNQASQDFYAGYDKGVEEIFHNLWRKR